MKIIHNGQMTRLYVLVAADGFTCCCDGTPQGIQRSKLHHNLQSPIMVHDWSRTDHPTMHGGWKKVGESVWP